MIARDFAELIDDARQRGENWTGRCPAHSPDHRPSLSWRDGERGLVLHCHRGCRVEEICRVLKIPVSALFRESNGRPPAGDTDPIICTYDYVDSAGQLLFQVVRTASKRFWQRRPGPDGAWVNGLGETRRVLYRLDRLQGQRQVAVAEGEKDSDRLWELGIPATTNPMGAGKWTEAYTRQLVDAGVTSVVLFPDNDTPGQHHVEAIGRSVTAAGLEARLVQLPGLPPVHTKHGEDVSDWLDDGHTIEALRAAIAAAALRDRWSDSEVGIADLATPAAADDQGLALVSVGELLGEPDVGPAWLVEGRLPAGGLGMLAGKPKAGKSTAARCLALKVARGAPWLSFATTRGPVIYLALEEKRQEVRAHFRTLGAVGSDPVYILCASAPADALARLRREVERRHPVLIIIDPLFRLIRVPAEGGNDYPTMSAALEPLLVLARETGAHVLVVHHLGKGERVDGDAILGSTAIFAAVDTALLLKRSERYRTLASLQRYGDDLEEITVELDPETRDVEAGVPRVQAELADAGRLLLAFFANAPAAVTEAELDGAIECRRQLWKKALRVLVGTGKASRIGQGGKADPFRYCGSLVYAGTTEPEDLFRRQPPVLQEEVSGSRSTHCVVVPKVPIPSVRTPGNDPKGAT